MSTKAIRFTGVAIIAGVAILGSIIAAYPQARREGASPPLKEGEYTVCQYLEDETHKGAPPHLKLGDKVCIGQRPDDKKCNGRLEKWTRVALAKHERYLNLLPDKSELEGASDFPHGGTAEPHLVRIRADKYDPKWKDDEERIGKKCEEDKRIILVQFCPVEGDCPVLHFGDTHAQN